MIGQILERGVPKLDALFRSLGGGEGVNERKESDYNKPTIYPKPIAGRSPLAPDPIGVDASGGDGIDVAVDEALLARAGDGSEIAGTCSRPMIGGCFLERLRERHRLFYEQVSVTVSPDTRWPHSRKLI